MGRLVIEPMGLHWLVDECPAEDLCAHGGVRVIFDGAEVFRTNSDGLSVSTGALYLLRYLEADHLNTEPDHIFPCCAFEMHVDNGTVVNMTGCGNGEDWRIIHSDNDVTLHFYGGPEITLPKQEWRDAVSRFSSAVRSFYFQEEKHPTDGNRGWFELFSAEWAERHASAVA